MLQKSFIICRTVSATYIIWMVYSERREEGLRFDTVRFLKVKVRTVIGVHYIIVPLLCSWRSPQKTAGQL